VAPLAEAFIRVRADTSKVKDDVDKPFQESGRRSSDKFAGAFATNLQRKLREAYRSLPEVKVDADSSAADQKLAALRARLAEMSKQRVGVDVDAGAALAEIAAIRTQLDELGRNPNIQVRVDAGAAEAALAAVQAQVDRVDGRTANVRVDADVSGALANIASVGIALGGLAAIPIGATVGAGLLALAPAAAAAGAGVGGLAAVAVPAIMKVNEALKAQKQATTQAAAGAGQAQARALAEAGAQRQLAAAVRNAGYAHQQALDQVRQAEQQYRQSLISEADAQRALTAARLQARRAIEDLKNQVIDTGLAVQEDELAVQQSRISWLQMADAAKTAATRVTAAQTELTKAQAAQQAVLADPAATDAAKQQAAANVTAAKTALQSARDQQRAADLAAKQAKVNFEQSVQRLKEEQLQLRRLRTDEQAAAKAGVDGSDQVVQARERLAQANQQVAASELAVQRARQNVTRADQQASDQIAAARQAVTQASLQGVSANTKLAASMAALSPGQRRLLKDWIGLRDAFEKWAVSLEPDVLPLFSRGIRLVRSELPHLTPVVQGAALAVDGLLTDVEHAADSPYWTKLRNNLTILVPEAITGLGHATGNVITGLSGIVNAFLPYAPAILAWLDRITAGFARWGMHLDGSPEFVAFMNYVREVGPEVGDTVVALAEAFVGVIHAAAPLAPLALTSTTAILRLVAALGQAHPELLQAAYAAFIAYKAYKVVGGPIVAAVKFTQLLTDALRGQIVVAKADQLATVRLGQGLRGLGAAQVGATAATVTTRGALAGLAVLLGKVGIVIAASPLIGKLQDGLLGTTQSTEELSKALTTLGQTGRFTGALTDEFRRKLITARSSVQVFKNDAKELVDPSALQYFNHAMSQLLSFLPGIDSDVGRLRDKFKNLDTTLTQMVQAGQTQQAAAAFAQLRSQLQAAGIHTDQINKLFPQYVAASKNAAAASDTLAAAVDKSNAAIEGTYNPSIAAFTALTRLKQGYADLVTAQKAAHGSMTGNSAASLQLREAFSGQLDAVVALYQATLRKTGSENQAKVAVEKQLPILYALAGRNKEARAQVDALATATGNSSGKQNVAKTAFFNVAHQMNLTTAQAKALWQQYNKLPQSTTEAAGGVQHFSVATRAALHDLHDRDLKVNVYADGRFRHATTAGLAAGGPVPALWSGATEAFDSQPAMLRVNEHVWTPEEVKAAGGHRAVERLRGAALAGELPGFDIGGAVTFSSRVPSSKQTRAAATVPEQHQRLQHAGQAAYEEAMSLAAVWKKYAAKGGSVVAEARRWLGTPYSWGGGGKDGPSYGIGRGAHTFGFDCSGLTEDAWWKGRHVDIGGVTYSQHAQTRPISGPVPGALGFPHLGHVMLASNRPGFVIQAPHTGGFVEEVRRSASDWRWPKGASTTAGLAAGGPVTRMERRLGEQFERTKSRPIILEAKALQLAGDPGGLFPGITDPRRLLQIRAGRDFPVFDEGGMLPPGLLNRTGQPEPVLTDRQWADIHALATRGRQIGPIHIHGVPSIPTDRQVANAIDRTLTMHGDW
jgi:hypothetical protein